MKAGNSKILLTAVAVLLVCVWIYGCSDNVTDSGTPLIVGQVTAFYDCANYTDGTVPDIPNNQSAVYWVYDGKGTLDLHHLNAVFNCCPEIDCRVTVKDYVITVTEDDQGLCDCLCLSDISYQAIGLSAGTYRVKFAEKYISSDDEKLEFDITLGSRPASGLVTVERPDYPYIPDGIGSLAAYSECGGFTEGRFSDEPDPDSTCVFWELPGSSLYLRHTNAYFNCCIDSISVTTDVNGKVIAVREFEFASNPCYCICPYDIDIEILNIPRDIYTLVIQTPDCTEVWMSLDLVNETSGHECFTPIIQTGQ